MTVEAVMFYAYSAVAIAGALGLVLARQMVHAVMSVLASFLAIAALFLLMGNEFLAAMQLFVYGGAVTVLALFVLMLTRPTPESVANPAPVRSWIAALTTLSLLSAIAVAVAYTDFNTHPQAVTDTAKLARLLFTRYLVPFEIAGLLLTIALVGAVVLARGDDTAEPSADVSQAAARPLGHGTGTPDEEGESR